MAEQSHSPYGWDVEEREEEVDPIIPFKGSLLMSKISH
jgi:hypothetical protein